MSKALSCPECEEVLLKNKSYCICGWRLKKIDRQSSSERDHRCSYYMGDERCSLPGTMSKRLYGVREWFCRNHIKINGDTRK